MKRTYQLFAVIVLSLAGGLFFVEPAGAADCYYMNDAVGYVCDATPKPETFVEPDIFKETFLEHRVYARAADFTNVYPQPSRGLAPVRNLGDGYLWVTIMQQVEANGEVWYLINPGEYVHEDDLTIGEVSDFTGTMVTIQPDKPFGWLVADRVRPSTEPGVEPDGTFSKMRRYTFFQVFDAVLADDGLIWYDLGGGRWMRQTYVSLIDVDQRPEGVGPNDLWVEVDLYEQTLAAYEGDRMVFATLVSSGLSRWPTNTGLFQVWSRHTETKMSGAEGKVDYYFIEDVPHTMFFDYDIALHGAFWHDRFGYKHSHGCVNMPPKASEWVFNWSENAEHDLWVYVHESDPMRVFGPTAEDNADEATAPAPVEVTAAEEPSLLDKVMAAIRAVPPLIQAWLT